MQIKTGQELKASRKELGMSREQFARCADVVGNTVYNWEKHDKLPFIVGLGLGELVRKLQWLQLKEKQVHEE